VNRQWGAKQCVPLGDADDSCERANSACKCGWCYEVPKSNTAPAAWSFMLAARARGLGTCWTSLHLFFEEEVAKLLGIPYAEVMQASLIPLAYTKGTQFKPGRRDPLHAVVHWDSW
jgi:nitroreductase